MNIKISDNELSNSLVRKQKLKLFLIFTLISFFFWGITKFSKNYSALVYFDVNFENIPELIVVELDYMKIEGYIETSGFQLLLYRLFPKKINVDISIANFKDSKGVVDLISQRRLLDDQISGSFLGFENDKLFFNYSKFSTRKIRVKINSDLSYAAGFNNISDSRIYPDSVYVSGPESILNNLEFVETEIIKKQNLSDDFELVVSIQNIQSIISIKPNKVTFNESIRKFTEQQFDVFINIINKPDSIIIKLFPEKVSIVSLFPFDLIENVKSNDFEFIFDYNTTENGKFESVPVKLINSPKFSRNVRWEPKTISYLIKK